jgi:hypothetical protein
LSVSSKALLMDDHVILDLANVPPFIDKDWIGTGKRYPKTNTPYEVLWAKEDRLKIPDLHLKHFPAPNLPVVQFLKHELPPQSAEIITTKAQSWFHCDTSTTDVKVLLKWPIPPAVFFRDLEKEFGGGVREWKPLKRESWGDNTDIPG